MWYIYRMEYYAAVKRRRNSYLLQQHGWTRRLSWQLNKASQWKKNTIWSYLYVECNEPNKLTNKIETEVWIHGITWNLSKVRAEGCACWKKVKELAKEHIWITQGHIQQSGDSLREGAMRIGMEGRWVKGLGEWGHP